MLANSASTAAENNAKEGRFSQGQLPSAHRRHGVTMDFDEVTEFVEVLAKGYREHFSSATVFPFDDNLEPVNPLTLKPRLLTAKKVKRRISQVVKAVPPVVLEDAFLSHHLQRPDDENPPYVSIVGGSGSGKSTILHQIALAWAQSQLDKSDSPECGVPHHLHWVTDYQFVLLLDMELASTYGDDGSICDLIRSQLVSVDGLVRVGRVWRHIQDSRSKVLVLLDNLHAVPSLRTSKLNQLLQRHNDALPHASLVTTSSDSWTFPLPVDLITCRLQVAEQSVDEQRNLIANMLHSAPNSVEVEACLGKIQANPFIKEFASSPFAVLLVCHAWRQLGDVPPTMAVLMQHTMQAQVARVYYRGFKEINSNSDIPATVAEGLRKLGQLAVTCLGTQRLTCDAIAVETWCSWPEEILLLGLLRKRPLSLQGNSGYVYSFVNKILADYVAAMWLAYDPFLKSQERPLIDDASHYSRLDEEPDADHEHLTFSHCVDSDIRHFDNVYRLACGLMHESKAVRLITALNHKIQQCDSEVARMDFTVLVLHCLYECHASSDLCDLASQILSNPILLHACDSSLGLSGADLCALAYYQQHCNIHADSLAVEAGPSADNASVHKFLAVKGLRCVKFSWHNWLHRNNKTAVGECTAIGKALQSTSCAIVQLQIALSSLSDNVVQDVAYGLKVNKSVRHLTLCNLAPYSVPGDLLSDNGARRLSTALELNRTLTSLCLPGSALSTPGIKVLAKRLEEPHCALEVLDLSPVRYVDDEAVSHLAKSLQHNRKLKTLRISRAASQVHSAAQDSSVLAIGNRGAEYFSSMLQINKTLEYLDIQNHNIGDEGAVYLADGLLRNSTLKTLLLGWSKIGTKGYDCLQQAWDASSSLDTLDLPYYEQDDEDDEYYERKESSVTIAADA